MSWYKLTEKDLIILHGIWNLEFPLNFANGWALDKEGEKVIFSRKASKSDYNDYERVSTPI